MSGIENISKLKKSLKSQKGKNVNASFNKAKSPRVSSPRALSPVREDVFPLPELPKSPKSPRAKSPTPPNIEFPGSKSPKSPRAKSPTPPNIEFPRSISPKTKSPRSPSPKSPKTISINLPGIPSNKSFDSRYVAMRPAIERFETNEILKKNPKVSMQELSEILGVTRVNLPVIKTKLDEIQLPSIKVEKVKSPTRTTSKKFSSCDIQIGGKSIDKSMVSLERSSAKKPVYNVSELKEIGKQLGLSLTGPKDTLVITILKELESRGC
jgi:hypothetical protein